MRCVQQVGARTHPHALLYHLAGHAVVLEHYDHPLISMRVNRRQRTGAVHALMGRRDPSESRMPVERAAVCAYAGAAAGTYACGTRPWLRTLEDGSTVGKRLARFTDDDGERAAWMTYLHERARVIVRTYWHEITVIAAVLQRERVMDRASLAATLAAFRDDPFRPDLRPLRPIPWERPKQSGGQDEVVVVYAKPKLSTLVGRIER